MKVAIRADASVDIGTGHVMRCLTLARALQENAAQVEFICRDLPGHMAELIQREGFTVQLLPVDVDKQGRRSPALAESLSHQWLTVSAEQDVKQTREILLRQDHWDWLVVDHYGIDEFWEQQQRDIVDKIMVIDDLADRRHDCDILLDQNHYADMETRYLGKVPKHCKQLLGSRYMLLRQEFLQQRKKLKRSAGRVKRIMVFFGGVDYKNETAKALAALQTLNITDISIDVVIGTSNPHRENLAALCEDFDNAVLHVQVNNMAELMAHADLCIGGGGTATWERCSLGLPALAWAIAENQQKLLADSATAGLVYVPDSGQPGKEEISLHLQALLQNSRLRQHMSVSGLEAVDCQGVRRVASLMSKRHVQLRTVEKHDAQKIFEWRNQENVRNSSRDSEIISIEQHTEWFARVLADENKMLFIGSVDQQEIGVLRFDITGDVAEISIYLAPEKHGKGYASALVNAGEDFLMNNRPDVEGVTAEILPENLASIRLFESCGYEKIALQYLKRLGR